jgi:integrase
MADVIHAILDHSAISSRGYRFDLHERKWQISHEIFINLTWIDRRLHPDLHNSFLNLLKYYAENYSPSHTSNLCSRFKHYVKVTYEKKGLFSQITSDDLLNYRSMLNQKHEWYLGALRGFFKSWIELGYSGITDDVFSLLNSWRLPGNSKGFAVQTQCPLQGPLSDIEYEALQSALIDSFELNEISLNDFVLVQLFTVTGRRPSQIGDLKSKDVIEANSNGCQTFLLNVPRGKQRGTSWREEFKSFALTLEIGTPLKTLIKNNQARFSQLIGNVSQSDLDQLPIFPNWNSIKKMFKKESLEVNCELLKGQEFHHVTADLRLQLAHVVDCLNVPSERTGQNLRIFPTRLRRTLATRAAREGYGELIIAELLDHTDTQNSRVYTENVPEHVDAINNAVALQLAPLAQAFSGMLVDRESDANRGDDLSSRVKSDKGNIGTCGLHGFCGAAAPVACYTCRQFQPWLDAPHQELLNSLISEQERIFNITQDPVMSTIHNRTIIAVAEVIRQCDIRRTQINKG